MWRVVAAVLKGWPQVTAGVVVIVVAVVGGYGSLPQLVRPVELVDVPVIAAVESETVAPPVVLSKRSVDCARVSCLALTFDDGPSAKYTSQVLDILERHQAHATFFLVGQEVAGNEALLRRMYDGGHEIGNHTWNHRKINELTPQQLQDDVARTQQAIVAAGVPAPRLFRPPYGLFNATIRSHVSLTIISWNIDPEDWKARKSEKITEHVLAHARPGAIVVMHDTERLTAQALEPLLTALKDRQYHLVTVSDLLDLSPGQPGIFYGR
jgi:peptidoglycan/xylan/chitin deacetylase (PgdA/CDA1 family)